MRGRRRKTCLRSLLSGQNKEKHISRQGYLTISLGKRQSAAQNNNKENREDNSYLVLASERQFKSQQPKNTKRIYMIEQGKFPLAAALPLVWVEGGEHPGQLPSCSQLQDQHLGERLTLMHSMVYIFLGMSLKFLGYLGPERIMLPQFSGPNC